MGFFSQPIGEYPTTPPIRYPSQVVIKSPEPAGATGWLCPACGKGNAPWSPQCPCQGRTQTSTALGTNPPIPIPTSPTDAKGTHCPLCSGLGTVAKPIDLKAHGDMGIVGGGMLNEPCPNGCKVVTLNATQAEMDPQAYNS